jgi:hypothetical protein
VADIFERDLATGSTTLVSVASDGTQADGASSLSYPQRRDLSDDGCRAAFQSDADNLSAGDGNLSTDVFMHDCRSGQTTRVPFRANDAWGAHFGSGHAALSGDGAYVAFASRDALDANDVDGHTDIYVRFTYPAAIPVAVTPSSVRPGTVARLALTGHDFQWRSGVMFDRGITVLAEKWVSPTEVDLTVSVAANAAPGAVRLIIANLGTGAGLQNGSGSYCTCLAITS